MKKAVKLNIFLISLLVSVSSFTLLKSNDKLILNVILTEFDYQRSDSLFLVKNSNNQATLVFFNLRKRKTKNLYGWSKEDKKLCKEMRESGIPDSSIYIPSRKIIDTINVTRDQYVKEGKGINEKAELFLSDSFNLKEESINWEVPNDKRRFFINERTKKSQLLRISKPIYNIANTKAVVYVGKSLKRSSFKAIILLEKNNEDWTVVYKQTERTDWICNLPRAELKD